MNASPNSSRRVALGVSLLASIVIIAPVIVGWFGGIDTSGCSFEDGCTSNWNLLGIWILSALILALAAAVAWLVHLANYLQFRRQRKLRKTQ